MKIAIASDKSGFLLKEGIRAYLDECRIACDDLGTQDLESPCPFFVTAPKVAPLVANKTYDRAILICGTGAGVSVLANKHKGVCAVACESVYAARMCRAVNDANILCMGGWIVGPEMGVQMVKAFLETDFLQGLEDWRQTFLKGAKERVEEFENGIFG